MVSLGEKGLSITPEATREPLGLDSSTFTRQVRLPITIELTIQSKTSFIPFLGTQFRKSIRPFSRPKMEILEKCR
jgi:hypothetical protein